MVADELQIQFSDMLSIVGAGGKTSLMFTVANELADSGACVLVTTTTAILHPKYDNFSYDRIIVGDIMLCRNFTRRGVIVAASRYDKKNKKLIGYESTYLSYLRTLRCFDFIIVEADGAKKRSIKAPDIHEPVIPARTDIVVGCVGLDCIGKSLNHDNVHRPEILLSLSEDVCSSTITEKNVLALVSSSRGMFKATNEDSNKIVFLNKADTFDLLDKGRRLACEIKKKYSDVKTTIVASLQDFKDPIKIIA